MNIQKYKLLRTAFLTTVVAGLSLPALATEKIPSESYQPTHRMANLPNNACPAGWSRLFGRNPPTCFENCQPGRQMRSDHVSGAWCYRCPAGWVPTGDPKWCCRDGLFGQCY